MKAIDGNVTLYRLNKMIGRGYYVCPLFRKTVLNAVRMTKDRMIELEFINRYYGSEFHTMPMTFEQVDAFLKENTSCRPLAIYRRIIDNACESRMTSEYYDREKHCLAMKTSDVYRIGMPDGLVRIQFGIRRNELVMSTGTMKCIRDAVAKLENEHE